MTFSKPLLPAFLSYDGVRPHHVLALYASAHALASILSSSRLLARLRSRLADRATAWLSRLSDVCLPLLYAAPTSHLVPDALVRAAIRVRCRHTLVELGERGAAADLERKMAIVRDLKAAPIAVSTAVANAQHYEVPAKFYDLCLGPNKKYSGGLWPFASSRRGRGRGMSYEESLEASEVAMLDLYLERAQIRDGMRVVDLGCGWGSLTLHVAHRYPNCQVTAISNSHSQREYILRTAKERGYAVENINVITCDASKWQDEQYCQEMLAGVKDNDRVISIEMFEHMKNYEVLLSKVHGFLKPSGKLFVHIFSHLRHAYHFDEGWMADNFFTGGTMPSDDLLLYFGEHFAVADHWRVNGGHYEKTSNAWLGLMDEHWRSGALEPVLEEAYGKGRGREWYVNWRLFYLACAELFGLRGGEEWMVSHYLFERRG